MKRKDQFPELKVLNLYAADTIGNGNCLFNALSDQLYGNQSHHVTLRAATIEYMRANAPHFKSFIVVHPGGGTRRSSRIPKRKNAGALPNPEDTRGPTPREVEVTFQQYLSTMAKGGAYGDNLEIVAFANVYKVDVCIYSEEMRKFLYCKCDDEVGGASQTAYIVHHAWEHYSSIRNTSGPHTGVPNVIMVHPSPETEAKLKDHLKPHSYVQSWMVEEVLRSLPYITDREVVEEALQAYKGNVNKAASSLMPASSQSSSRSSSIEREPDSDDEIERKPKKKADRRPSRPQPLLIDKSSNDNATNGKRSDSGSPDPKQLSAALGELEKNTSFDPDETEEEDWRNNSPFKDSETTSVSTSASDLSNTSKGGIRPVVRIKLSQPKKPVNKDQPLPGPLTAQPTVGDYDADGEKIQQPRPIAKARRRLITGAERERQKAEKGARRAGLSPTNPNHKKSNQSAPVIDAGIKILRI